MQLSLTSEEKEMITIGLNMRRNYIETGDISVSAADAEKWKRDDVKIQALSTDQMRLIINTENLIKRLYAS